MQEEPKLKKISTESFHNSLYPASFKEGSFCTFPVFNENNFKVELSSSTFSFVFFFSFSFLVPHQWMDSIAVESQKYSIIVPFQWAIMILRLHRVLGNTVWINLSFYIIIWILQVIPRKTVHISVQVFHRSIQSCYHLPELSHFSPRTVIVKPILCLLLTER